MSTAPLGMLSPRRQLGPASKQNQQTRDVKAKLELESIVGHTVINPRQVAFCTQTKTLIYAAGSLAVLHDTWEKRDTAFLCAQNSRVSLRKGSVNPFTSTSSTGPSSPRVREEVIAVNVKPKPVTCVAASRSGQRFAFGEAGHQPRVLIFDSAGGITHTLKGHDFGIQAIAFSPDEAFIATLGFPEDGYLHIWKLSGAQAVKTQSNKSISATNFLLWLYPTILISGGIRYLRIWDVLGPGDTSSDEVVPLESRNMILGDWLDNEFIDARSFGSGILVLSKTGILLKCEALKSRDPQVCCTTLPKDPNGEMTCGEARSILTDGDLVVLGGSLGVVLGHAQSDNQQITWRTKRILGDSVIQALGGSAAAISIFYASHNALSKRHIQISDEKCLDDVSLVPMALRHLDVSKEPQATSIHSGATCSILVGEIRLCGFDDGTIQWMGNVSSPETLKCCEAPLTLLASTGHEKDGFVAAAAKDRTVRVIQAHHEKFTLLQVLKGHTSSVLAIAFAGQGQYLITCGADHKATIYTRTLDPHDGLPFFEVRDHLSFQSSLTSLSVREDVCYIAADKEIIIVDIPSGLKKQSIAIHHGNSQTCSVVKIATGRGIVAALTTDRHVQVYATYSRELLTEAIVNCESPTSLSIEEYRITTGSSDDISMIWKLNLDNELPVIKVRTGTRVPSLGRSISSPALREMMTVRNTPSKNHTLENNGKREPLGRSHLNQSRSSTQENRSPCTPTSAIATKPPYVSTSPRKATTKTVSVSSANLSQDMPPTRPSLAIDFIHAITAQVDIVATDLERQYGVRETSKAIPVDPEIAKSLQRLIDHATSLKAFLSAGNLL